MSGAKRISLTLAAVLVAAVTLGALALLLRSGSQQPPGAGKPGPPVKSTSPHDGSGQTALTPAQERGSAGGAPPLATPGAEGETSPESPPGKLQLVLSPLGQVRPGQPVALDLSVKNAGSKPLFLPWPRWLDFCITTHITHPGGKTVCLRHPSLSLGHGICPGEDLKPGDTWKVRLSERKVLEPTILVPIWFPAPGTYRVKCVLDLTSNPAPWFGFWRGKAESVELVVDVTPDPPAVADGLAVRVRPMKPVFDEGEPLKFVLTYSNTSEKALALRLIPSYGGKLLMGTALEIELVAPKPEWEPWKTQEHWPPTAEVAPAKPVLKTLKPGETHEEAISLGGSTYQFWHGEDRARPTNLQKNLPPYWYRLVARIDAPQDSAAWSGKVTCWSPEFRIGTIEHSVLLESKK